MNLVPVLLRKLWSEWIIQVLVLWSLTLQIILVCLGGRRKNIRGIWIETIVWSSYLMADSIALFSLSKLFDIANNNVVSVDNNNAMSDSGALLVLWAPLLLLHLGGPDTITAYSVEDVRVWLRQAFGVASKVSVVVYIALSFWTGRSTWVLILTFPLFVAGVFKYSERIWVLWCTNSTFPKPLLPIPFGNCQGVVDELGADVDLDAKLVVLSYLWLQAIAPCISSSGRLDQRFISSDVRTLIWDEDGNVNFKFFEIQLGFMYDILYTKANGIYTKVGCIVRLISFVCIVTALLGFVIIKKDNYSSVDVCITYTLLVGAIVLEVYALLLIVYSDLTVVWMCKHYKDPLIRCILRLIAPSVVRHGKRWAGSIPTLNFLTLSLYEAKPARLHQVMKLFRKDEKFKAFMCKRDVHELEPLKLLIAKEVRKLFEFFSNVNNWHRNFEERGELALDGHRSHCTQLRWSVTQKSFDISIMIWHIATNYCYYLDNNDPTKESLRKVSKLLSDYMMYLLVNHPSMLGNVTTCDLNALLGSYVQLMEDAKKEGFSNDRVEVCRRMLEWKPNVCTPSYRGSTDDPMPMIEYGRCPSDASDLARTLMAKDEKWEIISEVWAEMLFHGAANCEFAMHLKQLRRGGEFLSQVWLLLFVHGLIHPSPRDILRPLFADAISKADLIEEV